LVRVLALKYDERLAQCGSGIGRFLCFEASFIHSRNGSMTDAIVRETLNRK